jgi:hypothetical protein
MSSCTKTPDKACTYSHPLIKLEAETLADLAEITTLYSRIEASLSQRIDTLHATNPAGRQEFFAKIAIDRAELQKLRESVQQRQRARYEKFMDTQRNVWLHTAPKRDERVGTDNPWISGAKLAKAKLDAQWDKEKDGKSKKREVDDALFREAVEGLKEMRRVAVGLFVEVSDRVGKHLQQVQEEARAELGKMEGQERILAEREERFRRRAKLAVENAQKIARKG